MRNFVLLSLFLVLGGTSPVATLDARLRADDQEQPEEETLILDITVGRREPGATNVPGFKLNDPLALTGKAADAKTLRPILLQGIDYLLGEQNADGSWALRNSQLRKKDSAGNDITPNLFAGTASQSTSKAVLTSLCGMALRRHIALNPQKIGPAMDRGLRYVMDTAPRFAQLGPGFYRPWTWSFAVTFLAQEYKAAPDAKRRADIRKAAKIFTDLLLQNQHKGKREPAAVVPKPSKSAAPPKDRPKRPSNGGFLGVVPAEDDEIGREGILIQDVVPGGPADKGGMQSGDRILAIDGTEIEGLDDLYEVVDSIKPDTSVKVSILRPIQAVPKQERKKSRSPWPEEQPKKKSAVPEDGGWAYYDMGAISFTTATCVLALMDARDIGIDVPKDALDRGLRLIQSLRMQRDDSDEWGFAYYSLDLFGKKRGADIRSSVGRLGVCGLALHRDGRISTDDLGKLLESFVRHRGELDRVKGYPGNHYVRSFLNAAYYYMYGHYYAARAANALTDAAQKKRIAEAIQEALLKSRNEKEGTWTDHEMWGQAYGTAMALMALGELNESVPVPGK